MTISDGTIHASLVESEISVNAGNRPAIRQALQPWKTPGLAAVGK